MSKRDFFEINPPPELDDKIIAAASSALAGNQRRHMRRRAFQWLFVPAFSAAGLLLWLRARRPDEALLEVAQFTDWHELSEDEFDMIEDLEVIEDLEALEEEKNA